MAYEAKRTDDFNPTDPWVRVDGEFEKSGIVRLFKSIDPHDGVAQGPLASTTEATMIDGIEIPLIKLNTLILDWNEIEEFNLNNDGFEPSLTLLVNDYEKTKRLVDTPGMKNKITVIMTMPIDGAYKKISLDFYITNYMYVGDQISCSAKLFCPKLESIMTRAFRYPGCSNKECNSSKNATPNTFELMHIIATETGLGFAATDNCKEINDRKTCLAHAQTFKDIIRQYTRIGGIDNDSIFDCWIDLYGYIVMINLPYVFNYQVDLDKLVTHHLTGVNLHDGDPKNMNKADDHFKYNDECVRIITNWDSVTNGNYSQIKEWDWEVNNDEIIYNGTNNTYYTVTSTAFGGNNSITTSNTSIVENSDVGEKFVGDYTFPRSSFIGCDMCEIPILVQEKRRDAFLASKRAKRLKVVMVNMNLGLMRGMLIGVAIYEYNSQNKVTLHNVPEMIANDFKEPGSVGTMSDGEAKTHENASVGLFNINTSGIYYIDGMTFEYSHSVGKLIQTLYLIKKDKLATYSDAIWEK